MTKIFIDSDIFLAAIIAEPGRGEIARDLLNSEDTLCTSLINIMEIRSVLTKKKEIELSIVQTLIENICEKIDLVITEIPPLEDVDEIHVDTLLYPMDCLIYTIEHFQEGDTFLTSFDAELIHHGAVSPEELLV